MSRRVFDVGLDMGRIRNGLKQNKESKRSKSYRSTSAKIDGDTDDHPMPNPQNALVPRLKHKKSSPTISDYRDHGHDPPRDILDLPAGHQDMDVAPPLRRVSPSGYADGDRQANHEESSRSPQIRPPDGIPTHGHNSEDESPINGHDMEKLRRHSDNALNFDLKPPPPNTKIKNVDTLSEQLFSGDHLQVILKDPNFFLRFTAFLNRYKPQCAPVLVRYLEAQKAIKAIEYANALAETIKPAPGEHPSPCLAATVDPRFEARLKRSFESLVNDALPAFITSSLTKVVTESMVREITGSGIPYTRELVGGLAEVFCLADPSVKDCPIVYASEEFYRTTRYGRDDVLGRNCRFLQGPKTNRNTVARLGKATKSGQESCETILNYRRDGTPFVNLLLTAPLYDNRGTVRYYIGAQVDVSGLVEDGRGLDTFERYLTESSPNRNSDLSDDSFAQKHLRALNEFGQILSLDESALFQRQHSRASSVQDNASSVNYPNRGTPHRREPTPRHPRRVLGKDDENEEKDGNSWTLSSMGPSGKLPGVYQNYLLVRPHPSLRIIFVSPALRIPGLLQSPFLSRIGGPSHVREGLAEAFAEGAAVTAKVTWLPQERGPDDSSGGDSGAKVNGDSRPGSRRGGAGGTYSAESGQRTRYISCTPLLGSDDQVGVWMVVMVENELVTGSLASRQRAFAQFNGSGGEYPVPIPPTPSEFPRESAVSDENQNRNNRFVNGGGGGIDSGRSGFERSTSGNIRNRRTDKAGSEGGRLYAEFMRSGGKAAPTHVGASGKGSEQGDGGSGFATNGTDAEDGFINGEGRIQEVRSP